MAMEGNMLDLLLDISTTTPGAQCSVARVLDLLPAGDVEQVEIVLNDRNRPAEKVARVLRASGFDISGGAIQRHRRGDCRCLH